MPKPRPSRDYHTGTATTATLAASAAPSGAVNDAAPAMSELGKRHQQELERAVAQARAETTQEWDESNRVLREAVRV